MEFNEHNAIYLQIADLICERVLSAEWKPGERIPSVREMSIHLEVNPNTVMRTYQMLETMNIIQLKRGTGFFLSEEALNIVFKKQKDDFLESRLPGVFKTMKLLRIQPQELKELYEQYCKEP